MGQLASPDMPPTFWQSEAVAVKVQAIRHAVGHTIGRHLAVLDFWQDGEKVTMTTQDEALTSSLQPFSFYHRV